MNKNKISRKTFSQQTKKKPEAFLLYNEMYNLKVELFFFAITHSFLVILPFM